MYPPVAFPIVHMCQKLWKLVDSRQSYSKNCQAYFLWPTLYIIEMQPKWSMRKRHIVNRNCLLFLSFKHMLLLFLKSSCKSAKISITVKMYRWWTLFAAAYL